MAVSGASLLRTAAFAVLFAGAMVVGRLSVLDDTSLSLVWPAAGVAVTWFCAPRTTRSRWPDIAALALVTSVVNLATGATAAQTAVFIVSNLLQVWVFLALVHRWRPTLWGWGPDGGLRTPGDLWAMVRAAYLAAAAGAVTGSIGMWSLTGNFSWVMMAVWSSRNFAGVLVVGAVGLCAGRRLFARGEPNPRTPATSRLVEKVAVVLCTVVAYVVGFGMEHSPPIAALLVAPTVWAAARLSTDFVAAHTAGTATLVVFYTLRGYGPFAQVVSYPERAMVVQLFVVVLAVVGLALALGRDERAALMRELAEQRDEATGRAAVKRAIIDSMGDGLAVINAEGRVTLRNPAAERLLGGRLSPDDIVADPAHYGIFHPDGTPFTTSELPYVRAAAGEAVEPMDVLVRSEGAPRGRLLNVRTTVVPDRQGGFNAVLVYQDVTAERRHHDELASFAGVVAHDLLNPLASVQGWTDIADEALRGAPDLPLLAQVRQAHERTRRSSARMRNLINDLLAYTTARDAAIAPIAVDLASLVEEVVTARVDAAAAAGNAVPRFHVGALPPVRADLVLVRQLLDNLIGNAVKYTAPGTVPDLDISAAQHGDRVRVTIADNGIGIPLGQHEAVFDNFHRAHRESGYSGTGLGLAICKRVVERHGGVITATDNPGGGTRFAFTLPAAEHAPDGR
ncbi:ATP-binding protein [Actinokineospora terrae]|uniref:Sensor-like histidine kinase SenX3 n=1 Tax=Actinokineospora terrae TaxID=155974 RepID=A0A1H9MEI0_9PSEU|nr:ATP-binding protein [Actinokineospora terrae]SER22052.1 Signal transduction histidine kinase [Actinokineospora terrae]